MTAKTLRSAFALVLAASFVGCSSGSGDGQPPVIDTSAAPEPTTSQSNAGGIPSSGGGAAKKKPDPVGALSPIIPGKR